METITQVIDGLNKAGRKNIKNGGWHEIVNVSIYGGIIEFTINSCAVDGNITHFKYEIPTECIQHIPHILNAFNELSTI